MDVSAFAKGLALGLALAVPVGPMSLLCMRRTVSGGFLSGLVSGLGIATADAVYGAVAAFGLVALTDLLIGQAVWLRPIGGAFIAYLGWTTLRATPRDSDSTLGGTRMVALYASIFALTLANPATILTFVALFASLGLSVGGPGLVKPLATVLGVFVGSALWWVALTGGVALARRRLSQRIVRGVNVVSGVALVGCGAVAVMTAFA